MFDLSSKTVVNRRLYLTDLYKIIGKDKEIRMDAKNICYIMLTNVLSCDTMNYTSVGVVKEIYILEIKLNEKVIPEIFIKALDKAINFHTLFVLRCKDEELLYGCYKQITDKGVKLGKYYNSSWAPSVQNKELPLNLTTLDEIYALLINELIPLTAKENESTQELICRYEEIQKLKKDIEKFQRQVDNERQSKKRFELNDELKKLKKEIALLDDQSGTEKRNTKRY